MKKILFAAIASLTLLATSCKKDDPDPVPPTNLSGTTWTGLVNVPGLSLTDRPFVLTFNADGTLSGSLTNGSTFTLAGSWNLVPYSTTVRLFFTLQTVTGNYTGQATLTTNNTKMESGTATNVTTPSANLNFTVTKS